jgi:phospholipase C
MRLFVPLLAILLCGFFPTPSPITHIVIVDQENRTPDNLFCDAVRNNVMPSPGPGGTASSYTYNVSCYGIFANKQIALAENDLCSENSLGACNCHASSCTNPQGYDVNHEHSAFQVEWNGGNMNGWNNVNVQNSNKCQITQCAMAYTPYQQVEPYYKAINTYTSSDNFFQDNQGPSYVSHLYTLAGTSACGNLCLLTGTGVVQGHPTPPPTNSQYSAYKAVDNPQTGSGNGCDGSAGSSVDAMDPYGNFYPNFMYTCFEDTTLVDELTNAALTSKYYQAGPGGSSSGGLAIWRGPESFWNLWNNSTNYNNLIDNNPADFITNVCTNHQLASMTWITPTSLASDHSGQTDGSGPDWVASIIDAIGGSTSGCNGMFWTNTVVFVIWDDWGGWYDHVAPQIFNDYEKGFRVPFIMVSAYSVSNGYVSHNFHSFGSILHFAEENFGLPSLGTVDSTADDLSDLFNISGGSWGAPQSFINISYAGHGPSYFAKVDSDPKVLAHFVDY